MKQKNFYYLINSLEGGGAERVTINFAKTLYKEGINVYIITLKSCNFYDLPQGINYISLSKVKNNVLMAFLIPWYIWKFKQVLKKYDLSDGISFLEISNFIHILSKKKPVISFRIHINYFVGFLGLIQKYCILKLYPKAEKIIVNSEENKYDLIDYLGVPENKVDVIYNPIDIDKIFELKNEIVEEQILKKIQSKIVYITTGRLVRQKHHEKIIHALGLLSHRQWIYLIVGDGPEMNKLLKLVFQLGLQDNVIFIGQQKNVFKYLSIANYFIYASEVEGFPNVLMEAKIMGLPIITSDFKSGAKEIILGQYSKEICKMISYPYEGKYGWLLDINQFEKQFLYVYEKYK